MPWVGIYLLISWETYKIKIIIGEFDSFPLFIRDRGGLYCRAFCTTFCWTCRIIYYICGYKLKIMVNNLKKVLKLMKFESTDDFYYLQILQRKKENPQLGSNSRVIKNYYISSNEYLINRYDEIKSLCHMFNARASIRLNKRSFEKVAYKAMINMSNSMSNREFEFIQKSYDRAVGQCHNDKNKKWIIDIDDKSMPNLMVETIDDECKPLCIEGESKILEVIPSKSGFHLITRPFDLSVFHQKYPEVEVHKDNPTNLYIP